ncbi:MAG: hypothetical protein HUU26_11045, partial [Gemmatimonadaceae bacterium]|nr:hypothetical protein [Gemmatimonadaceae bacterium]
MGAPHRLVSIRTATAEWPLPDFLRSRAQRGSRLIAGWLGTSGGMIAAAAVAYFLLSVAWLWLLRPPAGTHAGFLRLPL